MSKTKEEIFSDNVKGWQLVLTDKGFNNCLKAMEEYSQSQLSEYKEKLKAEIKIALIGIDKTEKHDYNGWWETSSGAEFGENKLIEVLTLIDKI